MFNLDLFISNNVINRKHSLFESDIESNREQLEKKIRGRSVLVIGGAGSIGSSFIKALLPFKPLALVIVDINENALTELTRDLRSSNCYTVPDKYITYPMDYASESFKKMFRKHKGFDIVANFAAHKHVRTEKDVYSLECLFDNNVIHAKKLLDTLSEYPPEEYFCVSTDKAANPVNLMGASKRIMEDLIFAYSDVFPVKTARFANVAFSNGSLPDGFLHRISKLQPISAPSDVKRYFVSLEESGQICMLACILGKNREIFFPKLDETQMLSFDNIAKALLKEKGYEVFECNSDEEAVIYARELKKGSHKYPVHFSASDTFGEKTFEEFYTESEKVEWNRYKALGVIEDKAQTSMDNINALIEKFDSLFKKENLEKKEVIEVVKEYLPNFKHNQIVKSLDSKM